MLIQSLSSMVEYFAPKIICTSGGLRVKTELHEEEMALSQDGLLTPISTQDNRRPSLTSCAWTFPLPGSTTSHPSSVQSSQEPSTPPCLSFPLAIPVIRSDPTGCKVNAMNTHNIQRPLSLRNEPKVVGLDVAAPDWLMSGRQTYAYSMTGSNRLSSSLPSKSSEVEQSLAEYNRPWTSSIMTQGADMTDTYRSGYHGARATVSSMSVPIIPAMDSLGHWALVGNGPGTESSTIVPAQTMVDVDAARSDGSFQDSSFQGSSFSSPTRQPLKDTASFQNIKQESDSNEFESNHLDYFDVSPSLAFRGLRDESGFEFKDAKRLPRSTRITKRRAKPEPYPTELVKILQTGKRHECYFTSPDGTPCKKKFQRVEHLRRHIFTHTGGPYVFCPVPECKKNTEGFGGGRKDNLRQHFKTHLRQTSTSRNDRRSFDEFYALLRQTFPEEEVEKSIAKLEEWRLDGGHLKSENGAAGKGRGDSWVMRD
jgi:hypothetical protein